MFINTITNLDVVIKTYLLRRFIIKYRLAMTANRYLFICLQGFKVFDTVSDSYIFKTFILINNISALYHLALIACAGTVSPLVSALVGLAWTKIFSTENFANTIKSISLFCWCLLYINIPANVRNVITNELINICYTFILFLVYSTLTLKRNIDEDYCCGA